MGRTRRARRGPQYRHETRFQPSNGRALLPIGHASARESDRQGGRPSALAHHSLFAGPPCKDRTALPAARDIAHSACRWSP
jgi:hypothetical protein